VKEKMVLHFPASVVEQPFMYHLVKDFNLMINILKANINPRKEGRMVVELSGSKEDFINGVEFMQSRGVKAFPLEQEIIWVADRCTHCGACTVICPSGALVLERPSMEVKFIGDNCIVCEHCIKTCPARAMEASY